MEEDKPNTSQEVFSEVQMKVTPAVVGVSLVKLSVSKGYHRATSTH